MGQDSNPGMLVPGPASLPLFFTRCMFLGHLTLQVSGGPGPEGNSWLTSRSMQESEGLRVPLQLLLKGSPLVFFGWVVVYVYGLGVALVMGSGVRARHITR